MSRIHTIANGVIVDGFERLIRIVDGYDCRPGHDSTLEPAPRCIPGGGGNHGCHGDEVHIVVRYEDGRAAVSLFVQTGDLRGAKDALNFGADYPKARNVILHVPFVIRRETRTDAERCIRHGCDLTREPNRSFCTTHPGATALASKPKAPARGVLRTVHATHRLPESAPAPNTLQCLDCRRVDAALSAPCGRPELGRVSLIELD